MKKKQQIKVLGLLGFSIFLSACSTTPDNDPSHLSNLNKQDKAALYKGVGSYNKLANYYKQQLNSNPQDVTARLNLVDTYISMENYIAAEFYLQPLLSAKHPPAGAYYYAAKTLFFQHNISDAQKMALIALKADNTSYRTYNLLGQIYTYEGKYDVALTQFITAWHYGYDQTKAINNIAVVYLAKHDYLKVYQLLYPIYAGGTKDKKLINNLAYALQKLGKNKAATFVAQQDKN